VKEIRSGSRSAASVARVIRALSAWWTSSHAQISWWTSLARRHQRREQHGRSGRGGGIAAVNSTATTLTKTAVTTNHAPGVASVPKC
jgi:hypothetical protein